MRLVESHDLCKGIFWITDLDNIYNNDLYFPISVNSNGDIQGDYELNAKSGTTYNHERTWIQIPSKYTHNKPFNYYPRGRVDISNGKATIYLNPNICTDEIKEFIIDKFNLYSYNGIRKIRMIPDYSNHYKCYLDEV